MIRGMPDRDGGLRDIHRAEAIERDSMPPYCARMAFCVGPLGEEIELFAEE